jgi:hypothetical protein
MEKYIMIFEDGQVYQAEVFTDADKAAVDSGILQVIRVSDLKTFWDGEWEDLAKLANPKPVAGEGV